MAATETATDRLPNGWGGLRHLAVRMVATGSVVAALWAAASGLVRASHVLRLRQAEVAARRAEEAAQAGRHAEAVEALREAVALEPADADHRLALGRALIAAGRRSEAEPYVRDVLRAQPVRGDANLVLARLLAAQGDRADAERAYYRAIYGRWAPADQPLRMRARLELVALFEQAGERDRLRAALLELCAAFPGDRLLQVQAGQDLLRSGFPDEAARQLRLVVDRFTDPGDALAWLARAEFERGRYADAFVVAGRALARRPDDPDTARLRGLSAEILSMDPDQPRLTTRARRARVQALLQRARAMLDTCGRLDAPVAGAIDRWGTASSPGDLELGRSLLEAAARAVDGCASPDEATALVLARLARPS